jgi:uroporphyrinogen decarboxylase
MTGKERVLRALEFRNPDRVPLDAWIMPGAFSKYGEKLGRLAEQYPPDIIAVPGPSDHGFTPEYYQRRTYADLWGCSWVNVQPGFIGMGSVLPDVPLENAEAMFTAWDT